MFGLHELQRGFARAMILQDQSAIEPHILRGGIAANHRLHIYRNNMRENYIAALTTGFPVLHRLVGEDYFRQMAVAYQKSYPSSEGNLFFSGKLLGTFLQKELAGSEYEYFSHIATLEWLCQESAVAADAGPLSIDRLGSIQDEDYKKLRLSLHPAVRLMQSRFPVMRIWQVNQPGNRADQFIDMSKGADRLLIRCVGSETELRRLSTGDFALLATLRSGQNLLDALAAALAADPEFSLAERLRHWVTLNVISGFSLH